MRNKSSSKRIDKPLIAFILMAIVLNIYRSSRLTLILKSASYIFFKYLTFTFIIFFFLRQNSILNKKITRMISKKYKASNTSFLSKKTAWLLSLFLIDHVKLIICF